MIGFMPGSCVKAEGNVTGSHKHSKENMKPPELCMFKLCVSSNESVLNCAK